MKLPSYPMAGGSVAASSKVRSAAYATTHAWMSGPSGRVPLARIQTSWAGGRGAGAGHGGNGGGGVGAGPGELERRRQVEVGTAVLDRDARPGRERLPVPDAVDLVDDRDVRVAGTQEVRVQRMDRSARLDGASR